MKFPEIKVPEKDVEALESAKEAVLKELDKASNEFVSLDAPVARYQEVKSRIGKVGKEAIGKVFTEFFAAHPGVESLRWEHLSNEWNDQEYYFAIREPHVKLAGREVLASDYNDGYLDRYDIKGVTDDLSLGVDMLDLETFFDSNEDVMRATFGGDSIVTVGRDGVAVVEESERD